MKTWLAKLKISMTLDTTPRAMPATIETGDPDTRQFETLLQSLDRRLKAAPVPASVPVGLHASTMRAVRTAQREEFSTWEMWRWLSGPALALMVGVAFWWSMSRSPRGTHAVAAQPESLSAPVVALEQGRELTQQAPALALAPLSAELESLNRDLQNAVDFVAAAVP